MIVNTWGPLNTWQEPTTGPTGDCLPWIGQGWVAGCVEQHYTLGWVCCDTEVTPEPEIIHPMGSDQRKQALRARILWEDDEILAVIMAFMETKH